MCLSNIERTGEFMEYGTFFDELCLLMIGFDSGQRGEPIKVSRGTALVRAVYFSVVTMTTLGFGDLYANPLRIAGHILLAIQVILGYVLLGALITRFAVLFTAGGPAGKFAKKK
jgi:hypothetical protein